MRLPRAGCAPAVEAAVARWRCADKHRARGRRNARAHPRAFGRPARACRRLRQRRDLLRHPARTLPAGDAPPGTLRMRAALRALVQQTQSHACALVHGDVSPKNILVGAHDSAAARPSLCCSMPSAPGGATRRSTCAFVLNHLLLKCLWTPAARDDFLRCFDALSASYLGPGGLGAARGRRAPRGGVAAGLAAGARGRQVARRIPDRGRRSARSCAASHGLCCMMRPARLSDVSDAWRQQLDSTMSSHQNPSEIRFVHARRVWDSRGQPTVEAEVRLVGGASAAPSCPPGASKGTREALGAARRRPPASAASTCSARSHRSTATSRAR